jgi:hypothetical protein
MVSQAEQKFTNPWPNASDPRVFGLLFCQYFFLMHTEFSCGAWCVSHRCNFKSNQNFFLIFDLNLCDMCWKLDVFVKRSQNRTLSGNPKEN